MKSCLLVSDAVYKEATECESILSSLITSDYKFIDCNDSQCVVFKSHNNTIFIAFRGTEMSSLHDIQVDCMVTKRHTQDGGHVHSGFWYALNAVYDEIQTWMIEHSSLDDMILVTGHSLGGAIATLCGARLTHSDYRPVIYTFGAPRIGDHAFASRFDHIHLFRFVNNNDIVPRLPPTKFGYVHPGQMWYITYKGFVTCSSTPWTRFLDMIMGRVSGLLSGHLFDIFHDHSIAQYRKHLIQYKNHHDGTS